MQNAFKNLSYGLQFCPLMKLSNTLKKLEYVPRSKIPDSSRVQELAKSYTFKMYTIPISNLSWHILDQKTHGQCSNCSIRSYYIWCLFSSLIHYMWNQPYGPSSCLDLPWCTSESGSTESQHSPVTDCVGQGTHLSVRQAVCRTQRNPLNSVPFFFIVEAFFFFFFF